MSCTSNRMPKNSFTPRLLKTVQMQGGARCEVRDVLTRTSQRRASAPTRQMGLFQQPAKAWAELPTGSSGVYCLVLRMLRSRRLRISRLPEWRVGPGWYVYTGSAKKNLLPRLERHLRRSKRLRWHIDYLRTVGTLRQVWIWPWTIGGECRTNRRVHQMPNGAFPFKGFGSSDCRCVAHLVAFPSEPSPPGHDAPLAYRVHGRRVVRM